uniref:Uncharacterized protein n=1 Tax=Arundo donax TaxID=35708 RepID=A0A0A9GZE0_ARUDO
MGLPATRTLPLRDMVPAALLRCTDPCHRRTTATTSAPPWRCQAARRQSCP